MVIIIGNNDVLVVLLLLVFLLFYQLIIPPRNNNYKSNGNLLPSLSFFLFIKQRRTNPSNKQISLHCRSLDLLLYINYYTIYYTYNIYIIPI